jgi:hypothetical protein
VIFVKLVCFVLAAAFVGLVALAHSSCLFFGCHGPEGDGWMLPFFLRLSAYRD